jgi:hypothetical protein
MVEVFIHRFKSFYFLLVGLAILLGCVVRASPGMFTPGNPYAGMKTGYDVSWPNCDATPPQDSSWGIVGVTGGLSLHASTCAVKEARWFKTYALYANTGYPGATPKVLALNGPKTCVASNVPCLAYNYGYAEGVYAVHLATRQGLHAGLWWLDVETENSWDDNPLVNRASIQGSVDAIRHETVVAQVGIYSYPGQWDVITTKWRPGLPAWAATGETVAAAARDFCAQPSFTGGPLWLGQYTDGLDRNLPCPAGNKPTAAVSGNRSRAR